jgi:large subunit ribosomal protein L13
MEIYINANNLVLGRLASYAAKKALLGNDIKILNSENAVITGSRKYILEKYKQRRERGNPSNGPFFPRMPDRFVRRTIRGMLPYKRPKGRDAFKRVMCYAGVPEEFKEKKMITLPGADVSKTKSLRYIQVKDVCRNIGGKI